MSQNPRKWLLLCILFFCIRCGQMDCFNAESIVINDDSLRKSFPGEIEKVEVRVDGICKNCLKLEVH